MLASRRKGNRHATRRIGIIMNGVTGRMGTNQHLVRSIAAIRAEGGVRLASGERADARPDPGRPQRGESGGARQARTASRAGPPTSTRRSAIRDDTVLRRRHHAGARRAAAARDRRGQARLLRETHPPTNLADAVEVARLAKRAGIRHGVVQDKLFLPGLRKLKLVIDSGFFGRMLCVRGEFGYWVFEGDWQPAQRPSWNYKQRRRRRHHSRHALPLALRARQYCSATCEPCRASAPRTFRERVDEDGAAYDADADDAAYATFELEGGVIAHINSSWCTRVRRDDLRSSRSTARTARRWRACRNAGPRPA